MNKSWLAILILMPAVAWGNIILSSAGGGGVAPADWRTGIEMVWQFEGESSGGTAVNTGSAGTNCDMTDTSTTGTVTRSASGAPEAVGWASFASGSKQSLTNTNVTCDNTWKQDADFTWGARINPLQATEDMRVIDMNFGTAAGFALVLENTVPAEWRCITESSLGTFSAESTTAPVGGTTQSVTCRYNATTDLLEILVNGIDEADQTSATLDAATADLIIGIENSNQDFEGEIDEIFLTNDVLTDAATCRKDSCLLSGNDCRCDSGTPTNYLACSSNSDCEGAVCDTTNSTCSGYNNALFNGCILPACNAGAP